mmetsp:Transcript_55520/g.92305  ORF Transcript_55520/g.92305 Transcript_55520/m.92305 type:complete len:332 (-) Transcript_55520:18-1013(-)
MAASQLQQSVDAQTQPDFSCRGERLTTLSNMLRAIHLGKKKDLQLSSITIQSEGIFIATSKAKSMIARCFLKREYFPDYHLLQAMTLCIDISTLIQTLTIFGSDCEYHLEYNKANNFLRVFLSDAAEQCITECELLCFDDNALEIPDLRWNEHRIINRITAKSTYFKDIFSEIDALAKDDDIVCFHVQCAHKLNDLTQLTHITPLQAFSGEQDEKKILDHDLHSQLQTDHDRLTISVTCDMLQFQAVIPLQHEICPHWQLNEDNKQYRYQLGLLRPALRAIVKSDKLRIQFNEQDAIQVHHMFAESEGYGWVDFTVLPQQSDFVNDTDSDD